MLITTVSIWVWNCNKPFNKQIDVDFSSKIVDNFIFYNFAPRPAAAVTGVGPVGVRGRHLDQDTQPHPAGVRYTCLVTLSTWLMTLATWLVTRVHRTGAATARTGRRAALTRAARAGSAAATTPCATSTRGGPGHVAGSPARVSVGVLRCIVCIIV